MIQCVNQRKSHCSPQQRCVCLWALLDLWDPRSLLQSSSSSSSSCQPHLQIRVRLSARSGQAMWRMRWGRYDRSFKTTTTSLWCVCAHLYCVSHLLMSKVSINLIVQMCPRTLKPLTWAWHGVSWINQDTEFPGVVVRPIGEFRSTVDYQYQLLRCNVDLLKIIQLGLTFMNEDGDYPPGTTTWQFNFKFNLT